MNHFLRQGTAATILAGPFLNPADGITPKTALAAPASAGPGAAAGVSLVTGGVGAGYTLSGWAHDRLGYYTVSLSTSDTGTAGRLKLAFIDPANYAPVEAAYTVLPQAVYDGLFGASAGVPALVADKAGFALAVTPPTAAQVATAVLADATAGDFTTAGTPGFWLAKLGGSLVGSTSVFSTASLANAPTGGSTDLTGVTASLAGLTTQVGAVKAAMDAAGVFYVQGTVVAGATTTSVTVDFGGVAVVGNDVTSNMRLLFGSLFGNGGPVSGAVNVTSTKVTFSFAPANALPAPPTAATPALLVN